MSLPTRPRNSLGIQPQIETDEDLRTALRWITWCRAKLTAINSATEQAALEAAKRAADARRFNLEEEVLDVAEYLARLEEQACDYARNHSKRLFADGKSVEFAEGKILAKAAPPKIEVIDEEEKESSLVQRLLKTLKVQSKVDAFLKANPKLSPWLRLKFEINRQAILDARKKLQGSKDDLAQQDAELAKHGLKCPQRPDVITIEV